MRRYYVVICILLLILLTGAVYGEDAVELSIDSVTVPADYRGEVEVPVNIAGVSGLGVLGISFRLTYDDSILNYESCTTAGSVADDWDLFMCNGSVSGQISVAMARVTPLDSDGVLLYITFDIVDTVQPCQVSPLEFSDALVNDGATPATSGDGEVRIGECQCYLEEGWNLYSFSVNMCFYEGIPPTDQPACVEMVDVVNDLGFGSLSEWFDSIVTPVNPVPNAWRMVIGTNGVMDRTLSPSSHSLKYMTVTAGYWVKIETGTGGASLSPSGAPFDRDCAIPLLDGWTIVSYPLSTGYYDTDDPPTDVSGVANWVKVDRPVAAHVFASIAGKYRIIIGQQGVYDPTLSPESSSLRWIGPCTAYWVKMNEPWELDFFNLDQ